MTLEETLAAVLDQRLAPIRRDLEGVTRALEALRAAVPPTLVPVKEAAKRMAVSEKTARRRIQAGEWPTRQDGDGRKLLVDLSALRPRSEEEIASLARRALGGIAGVGGKERGT